MGETTITIIAIFLASILMFVFPLMAVSNQHDEVVQLAVQTETAEFVDKIATKGKVTQTDYDVFLEKILATGNTYDVELEVQILDENPGKKTITTSPNLIGENVRYSEYTTTILNAIKDNPNKEYSLKKGDYIIVSVKNTNITIAQMLRDFAYKIVGKDVSQVNATYSSMVINNGQ